MPMETSPIREAISAIRKVKPWAQWTDEKADLAGTLTVGNKNE